MNVELGRSLSGVDEARAQRHFRKAAEERHGEQALVTLASKALRLLQTKRGI
jgi:hypothetical protein